MGTIIYQGFKIGDRVKSKIGNTIVTGKVIGFEQPFDRIMVDLDNKSDWAMYALNQRNGCDMSNPKSHPAFWTRELENLTPSLTMYKGYSLGEKVTYIEKIIEYVNAPTEYVKSQSVIIGFEIDNLASTLGNIALDKVILKCGRRLSILDISRYFADKSGDKLEVGQKVEVSYGAIRFHGHGEPTTVEPVEFVGHIISFKNRFVEVKDLDGNLYDVRPDAILIH